MTLQEYKDRKEEFNAKSLEFYRDGKHFECGFATGIAVLLSDIEQEDKNNGSITSN